MRQPAGWVEFAGGGAVTAEERLALLEVQFANWRSVFNQTLEELFDAQEVVLVLVEGLLDSNPASAVWPTDDELEQLTRGGRP